jgi:hypothetical protein
MDVYNKHHLPARFHYVNNDRIDDVIIIMDNEWVMSKYVRVRVCVCMSVYARARVCVCVCVCVCVYV